LEAFTILDIKEIKILIELMKKNDLSVFRMESEGFKIVLKKNSDYVPAVSVAPQQAPVAVSAPATPAAAEPEAPKAGGKEIVSPMVGTFYSASSPDSPPYVQVGQEVKPDTVVCIIEAMKVMNEIKAEIGGTITEVLAENGKPVQFGQALFRLK
jgi:acetyl-CoA carboxylase biotin carboxyl carrier protein